MLRRGMLVIGLKSVPMFICVRAWVYVCVCNDIMSSWETKQAQKKEESVSVIQWLFGKQACRQACYRTIQPASQPSNERAKQVCVCMWRHKLKKSHFYPFILFWRDNKNMLLVLQAHTHRHKHTHAHLHCHSLRGCHSLCICGTNVCWLDCVP